LHILKTTIVMAFVTALLFAPAASAQPASAQPTAAKVEVVSGNGQMVCSGCPYKNFHFFYPMVVRVSDANGNPIAGKTVNWALVSSNSGLPPSFAASSTTDGNGLAYSIPSQNANQGGSAFQPVLQSVISATADNASVSFTETVALTDTNSGNLVVTSRFDGPIDLALTGPAGSVGLVPIQIHVGAGIPIPGVSVRILSPEVTSASGQQIIDPTVPSASCNTGPGADPGSVLTDAQGNATCFPVFGQAAGTGYVGALVGGLDPVEFDQSITGNPLLNPIAYDQFNAIQLVVTQVTPGLVTVVSGNNQTVNPGQASAPLVVQVTDAAGKVNVGNQDVVWTVVSGAATVNPPTTTSNSTGQTQTIVTFSPNATGQVVVRAALSGNSGISTVFTLSTRVLISRLDKVSGDLQTVQAGQRFPSDLIVQVTGTNGAPLANQPIGFAVTVGSASLSTLSALTDATGQARVTVTAGPIPGPVTVNAFIATFSTPFTLTVIPPGPALSPNSFYNAGGLAPISALSPCSLVTVLAKGLAPNVQGMVFNPTSFGPWATTLAADTVTVSSVAAPIFSVGNVNGAEQLTFQVPCETATGTGVPISINVAGGTATTSVPVVAASPGIFETVMADGVRRAVVVRPDGTFVSLKNPARRDEAVRVFVTGLGPTSPQMVTGSVPVPGADLLALGQVIVGVNNGGTRVISSRVSPSLIGVYEVTFQVPSDALTGSDVVLSIAVNAPGDSQTRFSNGSKLPIL
jgi:uncharacterized protein (TIGR03437 family)